MMGRITRAVVSAALMLVLAGCWPVPGENADRTAYNGFETRITSATVGDLDVAWVGGPGTPELGFAGEIRQIVVSPAGVHALFVGLEDIASCPVGFLFTVEAASGAISWAKELIDHNVCALSGSPSYGEPFVLGDTVFIGASLLWAQRLCCPPLYNFVSGTQAYDIHTGDAMPSGISGILDGHRRGIVTLTRSSLVNGNSGLVASTVGLASLDGSSTPPVSVVGSARTTIGSELFYQLSTSSIRAYSLTTADNTCGTSGTETCPVWSTTPDANATLVGHPVLANGGETVYVGTNAGTLFALDGTTGAVQWSATVGVMAAPPALGNGVLYVPTSSAGLVALDAASGSVLWTGVTASSIGVQAAVAGGVVYAGSADGVVRAFDAAGCAEDTCGSLWAAATGAAITSPPVVSNGQLYVGTADATIVAYRLP
jgi:PQQ-like domain